MIVEFGSGNGVKTHLLLDALERPTAYVPVEISRDHLEASAEALQAEYPHVEVLPVCADFTQELTLPSPEKPVDKTVVFFPGSTVGNFAPDEAVDFLRRCAKVAGPSGGLLIGVDLKKDRQVLQRAYDDASGVTAAFNLNLLRRINDELGADFDLDAFAHRAVYDEDEGRIEMHLVSERDQVVHVGGEDIVFAKGESIHTESSYKYHVAEFVELAREAGFDLGQVWTDPDRLFSVQYYEA
jgi:dimethylhistidine N-methyltransferase